jgi:aspartate carbamoyltransferase regulatory subunit
MSEMREYRVFAIEEGTVIDHIPSPLALKVIQILGLSTSHGIMSIGLNFPSKKLGQKDLIKIENMYLKEEETNKLALIAPTATINIIKHHKLVEKRKITLPDVIVNLIKCPNPICITNHATVHTRFSITEESPLAARCYYCEREVVITPDLIS